MLYFLPYFYHTLGIDADIDDGGDYYAACYHRALKKQGLANTRNDGMFEYSLVLAIESSIVNMLCALLDNTDVFFSLGGVLFLFCDGTCLRHSVAKQVEKGGSSRQEQFVAVANLHGGGNCVCVESCRFHWVRTKISNHNTFDPTVRPV